ncbi:hypothetical protein HPB51_015418 [Rhipicephalus microplus]|uniref:Uncharacterized protein n=1 Tax=Rhipicephalus microplus TaxID=6941 RepID=A0A9J6DUY5_RHIMP|nr:hypothetical protein HPB51_015418 [Rhipicephalus microplus]
MCYDVSSCSARAVNESWAIGACSRAACEMDESGILLEVHYTCPRLQNRPTLLCDIIEDKRLPFPACCPRMICQRHKKQPPPTQTQLKPFTPHVSVDKELRKIPFVLKRPVHMPANFSLYARDESAFLEVQNTTLLDAIILNRIKALEAAANASAAGNGTTGDATFRGPSNVAEMVEAAMLTTQGPGVTTQDTTPFGTTDGAVTTTSPVQTTPTESPVEIIRGTGLRSASLQQEPRKSVTVPSVGVEDDDELFLNDAPVVPSSEAESSTRAPETPKTTTTAKKQEEVTELTRTAAFTSDRTNRPAVTVTTETPKNEPSTEIYVETTTRSLGLTVPESIFGTTSSPSTELPPDTTPAPPVIKETTEQTTTKEERGDAGKKSGNLPTILRSLVDNVFDYYDYIDYYVPGQKRNLTQLTQERPGDRRRIPESMMALVKEQLSKQKDENETSLFVEDLQADQPAPKNNPELTTPDPDNQEFQKELVTKMAVEIPRVTKQDVQDVTTTAFAKTETATPEVARADVLFTKAATATEATGTATASKLVADTTTERNTDATTLSTGGDDTLTLVKSVATQSRAKVNLAIENLSFEKPEDRTTTGFPASTVTSAVPQSTLAPTTLGRTTTVPTTLSTPVSTQEVTTTAVTATRTAGASEISNRPETTLSAIRSYQAAGETEAVFVGTTNADLARTTATVATTPVPRGTETSTTPQTTIAQHTTTTTTARNVETTRLGTSTETAGTTTTGTRHPQTATTTTGFRTSSATTETTPQVQTTIQTQPLQSERNDTIPLLTSPEPATSSVTEPATPTTPPSTSTKASEKALGDAPNTVRVNALQKDGDQQQRSGNSTTKGQATPPTNNNDVEYIDYVYYYDYIDTPDNSTANGTSSANSTGTRQTKLQRAAK